MPALSDIATVLAGTECCVVDDKSRELALDMSL